MSLVLKLCRLRRLNLCLFVEITKQRNWRWNKFSNANPGRLVVQLSHLFHSSIMRRLNQLGDGCTKKKEAYSNQTSAARQRRSNSLSSVAALAMKTNTERKILWGKVLITIVSRWVFCLELLLLEEPGVFILILLYFPTVYFFFYLYLLRYIPQKI